MVEEPVRFKIGDHVQIRGDTPPGHIRTPYYIRGKSGVIVDAQAASDNPEECAKGLYNEPKQPLYRVRFMQTETWPDYSGNPDDTLDLEIFQHWLEPL